MTTLIVPATQRRLSPRPSARETFVETSVMAWRALKKMQRNPEQFFDVVVQPLLFTAMFTYIFGGPSRAASRPTCRRSSPASWRRPR